MQRDWVFHPFSVYGERVGDRGFIGQWLRQDRIMHTPHLTTQTTSQSCWFASHVGARQCARPTIVIHIQKLSCLYGCRSAVRAVYPTNDPALRTAHSNTACAPTVPNTITTIVVIASTHTYGRDTGIGLPSSSLRSTYITLMTTR